MSGEAPWPDREDLPEPPGKAWTVRVTSPRGWAPWPDRENVEADAEESSTAREMRQAIERVGGDLLEGAREFFRARLERGEQARAELPKWHPDRIFGPYLDDEGPAGGTRGSE